MYLEKKWEQRWGYYDSPYPRSSLPQRVADAKWVDSKFLSRDLVSHLAEEELRILLRTEEEGFDVVQAFHTEAKTRVDTSGYRRPEDSFLIYLLVKAKITHSHVDKIRHRLHEIVEAFRRVDVGVSIFLHQRGTSTFPLKSEFSVKLPGSRAPIKDTMGVIKPPPLSRDERLRLRSAGIKQPRLGYIDGHLHLLVSNEDQWMFAKMLF